MADTLTPTERLQRARAALSSLREKAERGMQQALGAAETSLVAGAIGAYEGYHGEELSIAGADGALVLGVIGHAAAISSPRYGEHFAAMADGGLAVFAYRWGKKKGEEWKEEKDKTGDVRAFESARAPLLAAADVVSRLDGAVSAGQTAHALQGLGGALGPAL